MQSSHKFNPGVSNGTILYGDLNDGGDPDSSIGSQTGPGDHPQAVTVGSTPSTKSAVNLPTVPASPTPFTIKINWDASVASAPVGFTSDIIAAVQFLETQFSSPVTVTFDVGYGEIDGQPLGSNALGESEAYLEPASYTLLREAYAEQANSATPESVVSSLPAQSPLNNANYWVTTAQAKALGLIPSNASALDGYVGFAPANDFTFGDNASGGPVAAGTYDFFATAVHEFTEDMGRIMLTGEKIGSTPNGYSLLDLLHFSGPGARDFTASTPGYFSINGGDTNLGQFNTIASGDAGDWATSVADNPFDAFATPGVAEPLTVNDLTEVAALGWNPTGAALPVAPSVPAAPIVNPGSGGVPEYVPGEDAATGPFFAPATHFLFLANGDAAWPGGSPLASVADSGAPAEDNISYALSGWGAGFFSLGDDGGTAMLLTGPNELEGTQNGQLYALTVTATDTTAAGNPSVANPLNVVVGSSTGDTIELASLPGIATAAPAFIYGLGGGGVIDGTGMTGTLFFDGGAGGAETMTGGDGVNVYEFGSAADSTNSAMDIIANFNVAVDLIDMTGLGTPFSGATALGSGATSIGADSIGWQTVGGNTFVYANTHAQTEALGATDMQIELQGNVALTGSNFAYV